MSPAVETVAVPDVRRTGWYARLVDLPVTAQGAVVLAVAVLGTAGLSAVNGEPLVGATELERIASAGLLAVFVLVSLVPALNDRRRRRTLPPELRDLPWSRLDALDALALAGPVPTGAEGQAWVLAHLNWWRGSSREPFPPSVEVVGFLLLQTIALTVNAFLPPTTALQTVVGVLPFAVPTAVVWVVARRRLADAETRIVDLQAGK